MNSLLLTDTFDSFLVSEASITTFTTFSVSGELHKDFFDSEQDEIPERNQVSWKEIRPFCLSVIRGKRTPLSFKFVFQLPEGGIQKLLERNDLPFQPEDVYGLYLNCQYQADRLTLTTGTSLKVFSLDHSLDQVWDRQIQAFLVKHGLLEEE